MKKSKLIREIPLADNYVIRSYLTYNANSIKSSWKLSHRIIWRRGFESRRT